MAARLLAAPLGWQVWGATWVSITPSLPPFCLSLWMALAGVTPLGWGAPLPPHLDEGHPVIGFDGGIEHSNLCQHRSVKVDPWQLWVLTSQDLAQDGLARRVWVPRALLTQLLGLL